MSNIETIRPKTTTGTSTAVQKGDGAGGLAPATATDVSALVTGAINPSSTGATTPGPAAFTSLTASGTVTNAGGVTLASNGYVNANGLYNNSGSAGFNNSGNFSCVGLTASGPGSPVGEYTVSGLPSASAWSGKYASVSNPASGKSYGVRSNGTNWLYTSDQSVAA